MTAGGASENGKSPDDPRLVDSIDQETMTMIDGVTKRYADADERTMMLGLKES